MRFLRSKCFVNQAWHTVCGQSDLSTMHSRSFVVNVICQQSMTQFLWFQKLSVGMNDAAYENAVSSAQNRWRKYPVEPASHTGTRSALAELLLSWHAWGWLSGPLVQKLAEAGQADGIRHPDVIKLASVGGAGVYPQNTRRDILNFVAPRVGIPELTDVKIHAVSKGLVQETLHPILMPHELFHALHNKFLAISIVCSGKGLATFGSI